MRVGRLLERVDPIDIRRYIPALDLLDHAAQQRAADTGKACLPGCHADATTLLSGGAAQRSTPRGHSPGEPTSVGHLPAGPSPARVQGKQPNATAPAKARSPSAQDESEGAADAGHGRKHRCCLDMQASPPAPSSRPVGTTTSSEQQTASRSCSACTSSRWHVQRQPDSSRPEPIGEESAAGATRQSCFHEH